jgi:uncharacterized protein YfaS (alpha-2-macroglobulin family)
MKRTLVLIGVMVGVLVPVSAAGPRDALWQQVDRAIDKEGPSKTAIGLLEQIIPAALQDRAYAEATKAICLKIAQETRVERSKTESKPAEAIVRLQDEVAKAPEPMKPMMETVLAHWYWRYFRGNRGWFLRRTETPEAPGKDFTTWDVPRLLAEIDRHFTLALAAEATLKATPIGAWGDLLEKEVWTMSDRCRPTLYDFLMQEALSFYSAGEQAGAQPQDTFEIRADSGIFAPVEEFLAWQPLPPDTRSAKLKAIRLYQSLLAFHRNDKDKMAFIDADLYRLIFGYNQALGPEKDALYEAALERFANQWKDYEISTQALSQWARVVYDRGDWVRAHELAGRGAAFVAISGAPAKNPAWDSYLNNGASACSSLKREIERKSISIQTERVWNAPPPSIMVTYRNVTRVYFKAVKCDDFMQLYEVDDYPQRYSWTLSHQPWGLRSEQCTALLAATPALQWSAELPPTSDYRQRTQKLDAPAGLPAGHYFLIASHDPSFTEGDNRDTGYTGIVPIWVSDLAVVVRSGGPLEGFVLQARTGEPIAGATITRWRRRSSPTAFPVDRTFHRLDQTQSDNNGLFRFADKRSEMCLLVVESGGQKLVTQGTYVSHPWYGPPAAAAQTILFTDRSLYRPGQTIHYKGICVRTDPNRNDYQTLVRQRPVVRLRATNGREIATQDHVCNDYGAFSGSFTAPRDHVLGRMSLDVDGPRGSVTFNVEEYKRPKFQVQFDPPAAAPKLNTEVVVPGKATAYTGAPIGGAKVGWRVARRVRVPAWCWRGRGAAPAPPLQAIAQGEATTASDGSFKVHFVAQPDPSVREADEPFFEFQVHADVTDTTGETRSADRVIRVGYTALQATVSADAWQTPARSVALTIAIQTLDGQGAPAEGTLRVYTVKQPDQVIRAALPALTYVDGAYGLVDVSNLQTWESADGYYASQDSPDASDPQTWESVDLVSEKTFKTDAQGRATIPVSLTTGIYRAMLRTQDRFGKPVSAQHTIQVVNPQAPRLGVRVANHFAAPRWSVPPGETFTAVWGTGYDTGRAYVELECRGKVLRAWWTDPRKTQELIEQDVTEEMRGGFTLRVTYVRENRAYLNRQIVLVPWTNKQLTITWERFRSLLEPGQRETWTAIITGSDARRAVAEMVAALYDASLDQYLKHDWIHGFAGFRAESSRLSSSFENVTVPFCAIHLWWTYPGTTAPVYREFPKEIMPELYRPRPKGVLMGPGLVPYYFGEARTSRNGRTAPTAESDVDLSQVSVRTNLGETAFFFPHLVSGAGGTVRMEFTLPETLTQWKFLGFAHDAQMRSGFLTDTTVTAKHLMVEPNPPRFVREGDMIEFTVKITNRSAARQTGKVKLTLSDARTLEVRDQALGNTSPEQDFDVPSGESRACSWRLTVPEGGEMLIYKAVGATTRLSDGEQGYLPVLSRRILVTESLPLPIRGPQTKDFEFTKLLNSGQSNTLVHQSLTVQMVSQPAWYAVMALPYLMEYPYECSEQIFGRLYANTLAAYIANSNPKIRRIFDQWQNTPALDSPLEKNEGLKGIALEETPWVVEAMTESQARRNVGILFDQNRLRDETGRALLKLTQMQCADGLWPWVPGCRGSEYITLYITTGFGRLRHLGVKQVDVTCAIRALGALDRWMDERYRWILAHGTKESNHLDPTVAFYLYGRSFFLADQPIVAAHREARDYWLGQARRYWRPLWRQSQAHLAIGLKRFGDKDTPAAIMKSIKESSVTSEEMGMYWRDTERSWWWYRAPIETQAMMIEAFDEVTGDAQAVEDCRVWLVKQKQTRDWRTTKATADAVYGLLLRGMNLLASDAIVQVALAGEWIKPAQVEAGTGFYEERFVRKAIQPGMGHVTVKKVDQGVSWGGVHWQYLQDVSKITPYEGTPLQLHKSLYVKKTTATGQVLFPIAGPLAVGDELVVRIEVRVDRDVEYVYMKDQRGSGTEPVNVLSRYRYQDGLAYYESTRDTATHFFMDYLPKGVYAFQYSTRLQHKGEYQTGIASIQCMYAPEFNSHTESFTLEVK